MQEMGVVLCCLLVLVYHSWTRWIHPTMWSEVCSALDMLQRVKGPDMADSKSEKAMQQLRHNREHFFRQILALWSASAELTMFLTVFCYNILDFGTITQIPPLMTVAIGNALFRAYMKPDLELSKSRMQFFTVAMTVAHLVIFVGLPRVCLPAIYASRILTGISATETSLAISINVVLAPVFVLVQFQMEEPSEASLQQLMFMITNELTSVGIMAMSILSLNHKEYELEVATLQLETKVEQVTAAEMSGVAAQRLLSVTCDASVRLTHDLKISQPSPSLSDLLMCNFGTTKNLCNLEGVDFMRYVALEEHPRLSEFIAESSRGQTPARSLHLRLKDSGGISFNAELFHVAIPSMTSDFPEHLIGITQEHAEQQREPSEFREGLELPENRRVGGSPSSATAYDARHILDHKMIDGDREWRQRSVSSSASSCSNLIQLSLLEDVSITVLVDPSQNDFAIRSVRMSFQAPDASNKEQVPYLLEWLKPAYRTIVENWIHAHANAHFAGCTCPEPPLRSTKFYSPMASANSLLAGTMSVSSIIDYETEGSESDGSDADQQMLVCVELRSLFAH